MIVGIGTDIIAVARIEKACYNIGIRFVERILAPPERLQWQQRKREKRDMLYLATRFAAKEAFAKALGDGVAKIGWYNIIVSSDKKGRPTLHWQHNDAKNMHIHLSLSDEKNYALAFVIIERFQ